MSNRLTRVVTVASVLALVVPLAACSDFDPSEIMDNIFSPTKKPLTGDRKELFPSGTPGVQQGVPPELVKGYQPQADAPVSTTDAAPDLDKPKPAKPKPKPKPKVAAAPAAAPAAPAGQMPSQMPGQAPQASPWPDPSTATRQPTAAPGGTVWPDPPASR